MSSCSFQIYKVKILFIFSVFPWKFLLYTLTEDPKNSNEPPHDKTSEDSARASTQSDQSLCCALNG